MYTSLEKKLGHPPDFRVNYRFLSKNEGGRETSPHQGYRSDFWYPYPEHKPNYLFMIYPEFENESGDYIKEETIPVPVQGTATMWIINPATRAYHKDKIKVGTAGFFMEGAKRVAECYVTEIISLSANPTIAN